MRWLTHFIFIHPYRIFSLSRNIVQGGREGRGFEKENNMEGGLAEWEFLLFGDIIRKLVINIVTVLLE